MCNLKVKIFDFFLSRAWRPVRSKLGPLFQIYPLNKVKSKYKEHNL